MQIRALVLTSGGLDSILAAKILQQQGIDVIGIHFLTWFNVPKFQKVEDMPNSYELSGMTVYNSNLSEEYTDILLHPHYGHGSSVNPCIDCKILFIRKAKELMKEFNAYFIATGEVVGQRPMTQRLDAMQLIEKKSGVIGLLVRPLSARLLKQTEPEKKGWLDREKLLDISGRGRKRQFELARQFGIDAYPPPAGGCILTEKNFAPRFYDLVKHANHVTVEELYTLRYGRHFRIGEKSRLIVGRNNEENKFLKRLQWGNVKIDCENIPGPYCLFQWDGRYSHLKYALDICARYSDYHEGEKPLQVKVITEKKEKHFIYKRVPDVENIHKVLIQ